jgi:hypothetical protein
LSVAFGENPLNECLEAGFQLAILSADQLAASKRSSFSVSSGAKCEFRSGELNPGNVVWKTLEVVPLVKCCVLLLKRNFVVKTTFSSYE